MKIVNDVDITIEERRTPTGDDIVFVFVGDEYAGSAERSQRLLALWGAYPLLRAGRDDAGIFDSKFEAISAVIHTHALESLRAVLAI